MVSVVAASRFPMGTGRGGVRWRWAAQVSQAVTLSPHLPGLCGSTTVIVTHLPRGGGPRLGGWEPGFWVLLGCSVP